MTDGFLVLWKPPGPTSHDLVQEVRARLAEPAGHLGTLDPLASGVLVVAVGRARRLVRYLVGVDKSYFSEVWFGLATTSGDLAGEVTALSSAARLTEKAVRDGLGAMVGQRTYRVPLASAVKVGGEPLYRRFRRGEEVERPERTVTVAEAALVGLVPGRVARAAVFWRVSSGAYIRTLAEELGRELGLAATLASLVRLSVGPFGEAEAVPPAEIGPERLLPLDTPFASWPRWPIGLETWAKVRQGQRLMPPTSLPAGLSLAVAEASGRLLAVGRRDGDLWRPLTVVGE